MTEKALTPNQTLAHNLVRMRTDRDRSQRVLAADMRRVGGHKWTDVTVSNVERGDRSVSVDELMALALVLGVEPVVLLTATVPGVAIAGSVIPAALFNDWVKGRFAITLDPDTSGVEGIQLLIRVRPGEQKRPPNQSTREELREFFGDAARYVGDEEEIV